MSTISKDVFSKQNLNNKKIANKNKHGGNISELSRVLNVKPEELIDLSGNVNPLGCPPSLVNSIMKNIKAVEVYPDEEYLELRESLSTYVSVPINNILVGNGTTELIHLFIKIISPKKTLLVAPTYSEYEREISNIGCEIKYYNLVEENNFKIEINELLKNLTDELDLLILCNPNNPTGSCIFPDDLKKVLSSCREKGIFVMVDETYTEFSKSAISMVNLTEEFDNIFVIKGTSKFFCVPGLRLGYAICSSNMVKEKFSIFKEPWTVNSIASSSGPVMFRDDDFINTTRKLIEQEKIKIYTYLSKLNNIKIFDSECNFFLCKILKENITSTALYNYLLQYNIVVRDFGTSDLIGDKFFRFSIGMPTENDLLLKLITKFLD